MIGRYKKDDIVRICNGFNRGGIKEGDIGIVLNKGGYSDSYYVVINETIGTSVPIKCIEPIIMENIIFGIFIEDCDISQTSYAIVFGYSDKWSNTKDILSSCVYSNNQNLIDCINNVKFDRDEFFQDICEVKGVTIPIISYLKEEEINVTIPEKLINLGRDLGARYFPDFGKAFNETYWSD